jgi:hypothetical protein
MRFAGSYLAVAVMVLLSANAWSQDSASGLSGDTADKPYATIVARNVFGLLPIPPPDTNPPAPPVDPPPKITLNGIMTIFGRVQALYKVANKPKPGQPAKEDSYVLGEGERQDDIEVTKIDLPDRKVTFNNHGTLQDIDLTDAGKSGGSGPGPGGGGGGGMPPNLRPGLMSPGERAAMLRQRASNPGNPYAYQNGAPNANANADANQNNSAMNLNTGTTINNVYHPENEPNDLTPEQKVVLIEAQRMKYLQEGNGMANLLPPTPLTGQNVQENDVNGIAPRNIR